MHKIHLGLSILLMIAGTTVSFGQTKALVGQYFQNLPAHAPALTGANEFMDFRLAVRQQWAGFEGAPSNVFLSGYSPIKNRGDMTRYQLMRLGTVKENKQPVIKFKHGVGAFLQSNKQDLFRQLRFNINYAVHIPVFQRTYLSFGVSAGFKNEKIDIANVNLKNEVDDATYQSLLNNGAETSDFNLSGGISLNSERYYVAYTALPLINAYMKGNEHLVDNHDYLRHQVLLGARFFLNQDVELIPNGFVRMDKSIPLLLDAGIRLRYQQKYWAGISYRNDETLIGMLGLTHDDRWKFSYSYEYGLSDFSKYHQGTHEVVLGVQLFNYNKYASMW